MGVCVESIEYLQKAKGHIMNLEFHFKNDLTRSRALQARHGGDLRQEWAEPAPLMQKNFPPYSEDERQPASVTLAWCGPARRRKPPPMPRRGFCFGETPPYSISK